MSDKDNQELKRVLNRLDKIDEHFEESITADQRYRRLLLVIGGILLLIMVIYVVKSVSELRTIARPDTMTGFLRDKSLELIPEAGAKFEDALKANAPAVMQGLRTQLIDGVPLAVYTRVTELLDRLTSTVIGRTKEASTDVMVRATNRAEADIIKLGREPSLDEIRLALTIGVTAEVERLFPKGEKKHLFKSLTTAEKELLLINARIRGLFKSRRLSRYDMLKKRFVQSWTGIGDKPEDPKKKGSPAPKKKAPAPKNDAKKPTSSPAPTLKK